MCKINNFITQEALARGDAGAWIESATSSRDVPCPPLCDRDIEAEPEAEPSAKRPRRSGAGGGAGGGGPSLATPQRSPYEESGDANIAANRRELDRLV